jgi:hypothetical protein
MVEQNNFDPLDIRNFSSNRNGPLREFDAILANVTWEKKNSKTLNANTGQPNTYVMVGLEHTDIVVIDSIEPFIMPTWKQEIMYDKSPDRAWGILGGSIAALIDAKYSVDQLNPKSPAYVEPAKREGLKQQYGKRVRYVLCDGEKGRPPMVMQWDSKQKKEVLTAVWKAVSLGHVRPEGATIAPAVTPVNQPVASPTPATTPAAPNAAPAPVATPKAVSAMVKARDLLNGKTAAEFNKAALDDADIKRDANVLAAISAQLGSADNFLSIMEKSGLFVNDNGVYKKAL